LLEIQVELLFVLGSEHADRQASDRSDAGAGCGVDAGYILEPLIFRGFLLLSLPILAFVSQKVVTNLGLIRFS